MLILLSPSKTQEQPEIEKTSVFTEPLFEEERWCVIKALQQLSNQKQQKILQISDTLFKTHTVRSESWSKRHTTKNSSQAIHTFTGHVYDAFLDASFTKREYAYMQKHVGILSGLYGFLRPLDLMQQYRLEMAAKLAIGDAPHMTAFWKPIVTQYMQQRKDTLIIDLASVEYTSAIDRGALAARWIDVVFLEKKDDGYKQVTVYTKKARGSFAYWCIKHNAKSIETLKKFNEHGYVYRASMSDDKTLTFVRR